MNENLKKILKAKAAQKKIKKKSLLVAVRLPADVVHEINEMRESTGASQSQTIISALRDSFGIKEK
ncbi:MAG: hypothetical protein V4654_08885 [Bdellovibrionota bacterium]